MTMNASMTNLNESRDDRHRDPSRAFLLSQFGIAMKDMPTARGQCIPHDVAEIAFLLRRPVRSE